MFLVSVCIPTYNSAEFVFEALQSIIDQNFDNLEIIISDDASVDNTLEIVKSINDSRIKIYQNTQNMGLIANENRCIQLSQGKYIRILQADDVLFPSSIRLSVEKLEKIPSIGMVTCARSFINKNGVILGDKKPFFSDGILKGRKLIVENMIRMNPIGSPSFVTVRRACFEKIGLFDPEIGSEVELDMWCRILSEWDMYYLDEILVYSRIHPDSHTFSIVKSGKDIESFFYYHGKILEKKVIRSYLNGFEVRASLGLIGVICWMRFFLNLVKFKFYHSLQFIRIAHKNRSLITNSLIFVIWMLMHIPQIYCDIRSKHSFFLAYDE